MNSLFLKEKVLSEIQAEEEFHRVFLASIESVQSRRVAEAFLGKLKQDTLPSQEILWTCQELRQILERLGVYKRERFTRKFSAGKFFQYLLSKPFVLQPDEYRTLFALVRGLKSELSGVSFLGVAKTLFTVQLVGCIAEATGNAQLEQESLLSLAELIRQRAAPPKQEYLEQLVTSAEKHLKDAAFVESLRERTASGWAYDKNNSAQKVLLAMVQQSACPCEYFLKRQIPLGKISPFFLSNLDIEAIASPLACAMHWTGASAENRPADPAAKYLRCGQAECRALLSAEYLRYLAIHRIRIEIELDKFFSELLLGKRKSAAAVHKLVAHVEKYQTLAALKHVIGSLKKIEKRGRQDEETEEARLFFQALKHFPHTAEHEEYVLGVAKSVCEQSHLPKMVLVLNILYHAPTSPKIGFAVALLSHAVLAVQKSVFVSTAVHLATARHAHALDAAKEMVFDHFLARADTSTEQALESLYRIYRRKSVREFVEKEKLFLSPRLWKKGLLGQYYQDSPENNIFYLIYLHERQTSALQAAHYAQLKSAIEENAVDALCIIYTGVSAPETLFQRCHIDTDALIRTTSLISLLFAMRRVLEEGAVPRKNCVFLLLVQLARTQLAAKTLTIEDTVQELLAFLIHTGNLAGTQECRCGAACQKAAFWAELLEALDASRLIQYKYMICMDLTADQKRQIEEKTGADRSLYLQDAPTLKEVLSGIAPYFGLSPFFIRLAIGKVLPALFQTPEKEVMSLAKARWPECSQLIVHLFRLYLDDKCPRVFAALSLFGMLSLDALEEKNGVAGDMSLLSKQDTLINMGHKTIEQIAELFIEKLLVPLYYETLSDILLYIIQELLRAYQNLKFSSSQAKFLDRLKYSKYVLDGAGEDMGDTECFSKYSGGLVYRRGIAHREFLLGALTKLAILHEQSGGPCALLKKLPWTIDALMGGKLSERHTLALLQFYLFVAMQQLRAEHQQTMQELFAPVFRDIADGALIDRNVLRTIINSSLCAVGIFSAGDLMMCSAYLQDRHYAIWLLENELGQLGDPRQRDRVLTELQQNYLQLDEKDMVFGINTMIHSLSPTNLAAELEINNEHANLLYINREILNKREPPETKHRKYRDLVAGLREENAGLEQTLAEMEKAIRQWTDAVPLQSLGETFEEARSFITDLHLLKDCALLRAQRLPDALEIIEERRRGPRTFETLRLSLIHKHLFSVLPETPAVAAAQKNGLLSGVTAARKSGQHELSEKLMISSIIADDWRVFYEKALLHLAKNKKSLAKQALRRLFAHLPDSAQEREQALLLSTEIEESEETYRNALSWIKTSEKLYFGYGKYLEKKSPLQAFKMFCRSLAVGKEKAPEIVPKLLHYITDAEHSNEAIREHLKECAAELKKAVQETDPAIFRPHYVQIIARLSHKDAAVEEVLSLVTRRLIEAYPGETLWKSLSILKNTAFPSKAKMLTAIIESASYANKTLFLHLLDLAHSLVKISMHNVGSACASLSSMLGAPLEVKQGIPVPCGDFATEILSVEDKVFVFNTLQKPKKIRALLKNGTFKSFLCKARDDLRKDAKFIDLTLLLNSLFKQDDVCRGYFIRTYTVVPITSQTGVIEYLENTESLKSICGQLYAAKGVCTRSIAAKHLNGSKKCGAQFGALLQAIPPVFSEFFRGRFASPIRWLQARKMYTTTYAVMNAVGWIMGLGDRHGDNIMFDRETGETVHVDLNCIFDKAHGLAIPETVPFRLTQNIVDAFGPTREEGQYRLTLERVLRFLLENRDLVLANLLGFVHDPLGEWTGRSNTKMAMQVVQKIQEKLDFDDELGKASLLIEKATCPKNLAEMYIGWCSFM